MLSITPLLLILRLAIASLIALARLAGSNGLIGCDMICPFGASRCQPAQLTAMRFVLHEPLTSH